MKDSVKLRKKVRPDLILRHLAKRHKGDLFLTTESSSRFRGSCGGIEIDRDGSGHVRTRY